jgi:hypothetical protein
MKQMKGANEKSKYIISGWGVKRMREPERSANHTINQYTGAVGATVNLTDGLQHIWSGSLRSENTRAAKKK